MSYVNCAQLRYTWAERRLDGRGPASASSYGRATGPSAAERPRDQATADRHVAGRASGAARDRARAGHPPARVRRRPAGGEAQCRHRRRGTAGQLHRSTPCSTRLGRGGARSQHPRGGRHLPARTGRGHRPGRRRRADQRLGAARLASRERALGAATHAGRLRPGSVRRSADPLRASRRVRGADGRPHPAPARRPRQPAPDRRTSRAHAGRRPAKLTRAGPGRPADRAIPAGGRARCGRPRPLVGAPVRQRRRLAARARRLRDHEPAGPSGAGRPVVGPLGRGDRARQGADCGGADQPLGHWPTMPPPWPRYAPGAGCSTS